jgi:hypothetical protein
MANEYYFAVNTDDDKGVPFGPVDKDNMDISRLLIDFSCWLDPSESITLLEHLLIAADPPQTVPPWQANYPLDQTSSIVIPEDLYPLSFWRNNIVQAGKAVALDMASGTPGLTYVVSFVATAGVSLRKREVDVLLKIDQPLNPGMLALAPTFPVYVYPLFITMTTALPLGFQGRVYIDNQQSAPITVTLPPSPALGDVVMVLDYGLTASTYPVTFIGAFGSENFGDIGTEFVSNINGDDLTFEWTGIYWAVGTKLFPILG